MNKYYLLILLLHISFMLSGQRKKTNIEKEMIYFHLGMNYNFFQPNQTKRTNGVFDSPSTFLTQNIGVGYKYKMNSFLSHNFEIIYRKDKLNFKELYSSYTTVNNERILYRQVSGSSTINADQITMKYEFGINPVKRLKWRIGIGSNVGVLIDGGRTRRIEISEKGKLKIVDGKLQYVEHGSPISYNSIEIGNYNDYTTEVLLSTDIEIRYGQKLSFFPGITYFYHYNRIFLPIRDRIVFSCKIGINL